MAKKFLKPMSVNQTADMFVKRFYGGDDPAIIGQIREAILRKIKGQNTPKVNNFLSSFTKDGSLLTELDATIKESTPIWKDPQGYLQGLLGQNVDLWSLTDEELQNRTEILNELSKDTEAYKLDSAVSHYDPGIGIYDQSYNYSFSPVKGINTSAELNIIQDIITERKRKAQAEQAYQDYLTALPGELASGRNQFLNTQRDINKKRLSQLENPIKESLNAKGRLFGGGYSDLLTEEAINMESEIQNIQAQLEAEDNQLYFNAAYDNQMRKLLETEQNYSDVLSNVRSNILQNQKNIFNTKQRELDQANQLSLNEKQYNAQLKIYQDKIDADNERNRLNARKTKFNQLSNSIFSGIGAIGGTVVGGPSGTMVGSKVGSSLSEVK